MKRITHFPVFSRLLFFIACSFSLSGCVTLYKPNAIHSPMLEKKGDGHISSSLGITGVGLASLQADYAISNHVGFMASGMYHYKSSNYTNDLDAGTEKLNIVFGEFGAGYFDKFENSESILLQCYGGGGYGKSQAQISSIFEQDPKVSANFYDFFIQPGVVFTGKYINMGLDFRVKYVQLYNLNSYKLEDFEWWNFSYTLEQNYDMEFLLFEPTFTMSVGGKHIRGLMQAGLTVPIVNSESYFGTSSGFFLNAPIFKFGVGLSYAFGRKAAKVEF